MLELVKGQVSEKIIVTLNELITLTAPYFLFVFTNVTTKDQVKFIKATAADESLYPYRYNKFDVNTQALFGQKPRGYWDYVVYEQSSAINTNPAGLNPVEYGKLILYEEGGFEFEKYDAPVTYKAYDG